MKILVFLSVVVCGVLCESDSDCIERYIQKIQTKSQEDAVICENKVRNYTAEFKTSFSTFLDPTIDRDCAIGVFDQYKIADVYLKGLAKQLRGLIDEKDFKESVFATQKDLSGVQGICMNDDQFRFFFENIKSELKSRTKNDLHSSLCMQKYFVEKEIINPTEFDIDSRSKYAANCGEIINSLQESNLDGFGLDLIFGMPGDEVWSCLKERSKSELWTARIEAFNYLSNLEISDAEREEIQKKYFDFIRLKSRAPFECIQKHL